MSPNGFPELHVVDMIALALVAIHAITGMMRGFIDQAVRLAAWIGGLLLARHSAEEAGIRLQKVASSLTDSQARVCAWVLLLFGCVLAGAVLARLLHAVFERLGFRAVNRLFGLVLGTAKGALFVAVALVILSRFAEPLGIEEALAKARAPQIAAKACEELPACFDGEITQQYAAWLDGAKKGLAGSAATK